MSRNSRSPWRRRRRDANGAGKGRVVGPERPDVLPGRWKLRSGARWVRLREERFIAALLAVAWIGLVALQFSWEGEWRGLPRPNARLPEFRVNVNRAEMAELTLLPGIGPTLAERMIESRAREGPFRDLDDLERVRGIGPGVVRRIAAYVSFGDSDERERRTFP